MILQPQGMQRPVGGRMCAAPWGRVGAARGVNAPGKKVFGNSHFELTLESEALSFSAVPVPGLTRDLVAQNDEAPDQVRGAECQV